MKLTEQQFQQTLSSLGCVVENSTKENRTSPIRIPTGTKVAIIPCGEAGRRELATAGLVSLSDMGISISNRKPMRIGETFIMRIGPAGGHAAFGILCMVVQSQMATGAYTVGATFTRVLTASNTGQIGEHQSAAAGGELDDQGLAHVREVEKKLSQWWQ